MAAWEFYECSVEDQRAFVAVDLDLYDAAPDPARPTSVRVVIPHLLPREDGLPSSDERRRLDEIGDVVVHTMTTAGAVWVGRAHFGGATRLYFYAPSITVGRAAAEVATLAITDRALDAGGFDDPEWEQYFWFLYPNDLAWQWIMDRRVCDELSARGDDLAVARTIDHTASFAEATARAAFATAIEAEGYTVDGEEAADGEHPFVLHFSHRRAPLEMFAVTIELHRLAGEHGGGYDGWGCETHT